MGRLTDDRISRSLEYLDAANVQSARNKASSNPMPTLAPPGREESATSVIVLCVLLWEYRVPGVKYTWYLVCIGSPNWVKHTGVKHFGCLMDSEQNLTLKENANL